MIGAGGVECEQSDRGGVYVFPHCFTCASLGPG